MDIHVLLIPKHLLVGGSEGRVKELLHLAVSDSAIPHCRLTVQVLRIVNLLSRRLDGEEGGQVSRVRLDDDEGTDPPRPRHHAG